GVHRYLHSFPTRRSSDLHEESFNWRGALIKGFDKYPEHYTLLSGSIPPNPTQLLTNGRFENLLNEAKEEFDYIVVDTAPTILVRSEEHTSELQSRENLVC